MLDDSFSMIEERMIPSYLDFSVLSIGLSKYIQSKQINYFENIKLKIEQISKLNEKFIISNESSLKFFQSFDLNNYKNNLNKIIN